MLPLAIATITAALILYTVAVLWERRSGSLRGRHLMLFVLGLGCDTLGTTLMSRISGSRTLLTFHGLTGALAILLMAGHTLWAAHVHAHPAPAPKLRFHRASLLVWHLWLVPYLSGMAFGLSG